MKKSVMPALRQTAGRFTARAVNLTQNYFMSPEIFARGQARIFPRNGSALGIKVRSQRQAIILCPK